MQLVSVFKRLKEHSTLFILVFCFILFCLVTLNRFPGAFPDESSFMIAAYSIFHPSKVSTDIFAQNITFIEETVFTQYGPVFAFLYGLGLFITGLSLEGARALTVSWAAVALVLIYLILYKRFGIFFAIFGVAIVLTDYFFLYSAKFVRMEILSLVLLLASIYYYMNYFLEFQKVRIRNVLILGTLLGGGLMIHFFHGAIPFFAILLHLVLSRKQRYAKTALFVAVIPIGVTIIWFVATRFIFTTQAISESDSFILDRLTTDWHSLRSVFRDRGTFSFVNMMFYIAALPLSLYIYNKSLVHSFVSILYIFGFSIVIWGASLFYLSILPVLFSLVIVFFAKGLGDNRIFIYLFIGLLIVFGILQQLIILNATSRYDYHAYVESVLACIPEEAKQNIYFQQISPDPFIPIVSKSLGHNFAYQAFHDTDGSRNKKYLTHADIYVTYAITVDIIRSPDYISSQNDKTSREQVDEYLRSSLGLDPETINFVYRNAQDACIVPATIQTPSVAVIKLN